MPVDCFDIPTMTFKVALFFTSGKVPNFDTNIIGAGGKLETIIVVIQGSKVVD